jgi:hypothetical protein
MERRRFARERLRWDAQVPVPLWFLGVLLFLGLVQFVCIGIAMVAR